LEGHAKTGGENSCNSVLTPVGKNASALFKNKRHRLNVQNHILERADRCAESSLLEPYKTERVRWTYL
jgi:hypothetical protein